MNRDEALRLANLWQDGMRECDAQMDAVCDLLGNSPEAPLPAAIYKLQGDYTRAVSDLLGISEEWLMAWWLEHQHGATPMQAGLKGEPLRNITTIDALLELARDDQEGAKHV